MSGRPVRDRPQWTEAALWFDKAAEDIRAAWLLIHGEAISSASFHVQQALEKLLKGLLVAARQDVRRTHDLEDLSAAAKRCWPSLIPPVFPLAAINSWYLISRYPDSDDVPPSLTEIEQALREIEALLAVTRAEMTK